MKNYLFITLTLFVVQFSFSQEKTEVITAAVTETISSDVIETVSNENLEDVILKLSAATSAISAFFHNIYWC